MPIFGYVGDEMLISRHYIIGEARSRVTIYPARRETTSFNWWMDYVMSYIIGFHNYSQLQNPQGKTSSSMRQLLTVCLTFGNKYVFVKRRFRGLRINHFNFKIKQ
jgi:hypothetical protein